MTDVAAGRHTSHRINLERNLEQDNDPFELTVFQGSGLCSTKPQWQRVAQETRNRLDCVASEVLYLPIELDIALER